MLCVVEKVLAVWNERRSDVESVEAVDGEVEVCSTFTGTVSSWRSSCRPLPTQVPPSSSHETRQRY